MSSTALVPCRRQKVYGLRSFLEPGCPIDIGRPFRDNIRLFLLECAESESYNVEGMPVWVTMLVDEKVGVVIPLYTIEEVVQLSRRPFCDYCRCTGWSHHFVTKRRYHLIIPVDSLWDRPLHGKILDLQNHLLHALIHCNGYGHLLCINGQEGGSNYISGSEIMDLFDRICSTLRTREITVDDTSKKRSMELRLLYGVAYRQTWFGKWGYRFCHGNYGITESAYERAIEIVSSLNLDQILEDLRNVGGDREIRAIVSCYRKRSETQIVTLRELLCGMLNLKSQMPLLIITNERVGSASSPATKKRTPRRQNFPLLNKKKIKNRKFSTVATELESRWSVKRMERAAAVIVQTLSKNWSSGDHSGMSRQAVRDVARLEIGDTGLLDFVLKSLGDCLVGDYVVRRTVNPSTRTLEFKIEQVHGSHASTSKRVEPRVEEESSVAIEADPVIVRGPIGKAEVHKDILHVYKNVLEHYSESRERVAIAVQVLLDTRHFSKCWPFKDDDDTMLRYFCCYMPSSPLEKEEMYRGVPVEELVVVPPYATTEDLRAAGECAMRDTYIVMDSFVACSVEAEGAGRKGEGEEVLFGAVESGGRVWMRGEGTDAKSELKYEGGVDDWKVDCRCGARDDDGERMVACDICEVWQHTRCAGIKDGDAVPWLFLCARCGSMLVPPEAQLPQPEFSY
ncbi:PHD finger protein MALE MEIOCYTE DEATH 1 [Aristolochia californica]|uniref:PHD finger protein MALE MEIOCYTE DEATH 1 n=1 Tax=Aristolochia californica TaxID=171875 RepID=UPI0035E16030